MFSTLRTTCALTVTTLALGATPLAAQDYSRVEIVAIPIEAGIFMLTGEGGNIGVSVGEDGVFMIDDQFAPLSEKITAVLKGLSDQPVSYLLNTHWHFDHTGGNENFGAAGAVIVAHDNVRERMSTDQFIEAFGRAVPAAPDIALPVVTFSDEVSFHFNGDTIDVVHVAAAHTDGDSLVHFENANVLHTGDTFFNGFFPFIDTSSGGSLAGMIAAVERALELVDDDTTIMPGHGPVATRIDLLRYRDMLVEVRDTVAPLVEGGATREEVVARNPLGALGPSWGAGFLDTMTFTGIVYDSLSAG